MGLNGRKKGGNKGIARARKLVLREQAEARNAKTPIEKRRSSRCNDSRCCGPAA